MFELMFLLLDVHESLVKAQEIALNSLIRLKFFKIVIEIDELLFLERVMLLFFYFFRFNFASTG